MQHLHNLGEGENSIVGGHLIEGAFQCALGAGAVVAADVDDDRIVELAHVLDGLDDSANLIVSIGNIAGKGFRLAGVEFFLHQ